MKKKYYYFVYRTETSLKSRIVECNGEFSLVERMKEIIKDEKQNAIITFWKEISKNEYQEYLSFIDDVHDFLSDVNQ